MFKILVFLDLTQISPSSFNVFEHFCLFFLYSFPAPILPSNLFPTLNHRDNGRAVNCCPIIGK